MLALPRAVRPSYESPFLEGPIDGVGARRVPQTRGRIADQECPMLRFGVTLPPG